MDRKAIVLTWIGVLCLILFLLSAVLPGIYSWHVRKRERQELMEQHQERVDKILEKVKRY